MRVIHQILPSVDQGDAITQFAILVRNELRSLGYRSDIFVPYVPPPLSREARVLRRHPTDHPDAGLIYHHSIGSSVAGYVARAPGRKLLVYHNITPPEFIDPYSRPFARLLTLGRQQLAALVEHIPAAVGVSRFNADELTAVGYRRVGVLPISVDFHEWDREPGNPDLARRLRNGRTTIVFVGRVVPNKCPHDLLDLFDYYVRHLEPDARLMVIGGFDPRLTTYNADLVERAREVPGEVHLTGKWPFARLVTALRGATLFCSMSEHEGFMVPLVEAMHVDLPVLAYNIPAVRETLGEAGVAFDRKDIPAVAEMAHEIAQNVDFREALLAGQRKRSQDFSPSQLRDRLTGIIAWWLAT